ncbi:MAG: chemotaxis protein CheA [Treponema sp. CETP13]|nr:MAG: chemotaxis protein CheA [Treponema sp. CETP13]
MSDYLDINNEELLQDFFSEANLQVEQLESNILVIENDPKNHEAISEIFRAAHTLKGGSATVEMTEITEFTHLMEDLLDEIRSDNIQVTEDVVDVLFSAVDIIKAMLEERSNGSKYEEDTSSVEEKIRKLLPAKEDKKKKKKDTSEIAALASQFAPKSKKNEDENQVDVSSAVSNETIPDELPSPSSLLSEYELLELKQTVENGEQLWGITVLFDENNPMNTVGGIQVFASLKDKGTLLRTIPEFEELYEDEFHSQVVYFISTSATGEELEDCAFLDDVVLACDAKCLDTEEIAEDVPDSVKKNDEIVDTTKEGEETSESKTTEVESKKEEDTTSLKKQSPQKVSTKKKSSMHNANASLLRVDSRRIDGLLNLVSETVIVKASFNQIASQMSNLQSKLQSTENIFKERIHSFFEAVPEYIEMNQNGVSIKEIKAKMLQDFGDIDKLYSDVSSTYNVIDGKLHSSTQNLGRIAGELQEGVMKIRMVPISQIFSRFPRVVRDLSKDLNKKINLVIEGEDTELDKSVIEDLLDPIMHCVRNSADHGIEMPEIRKKAGKPEEGTLLLRAKNEGNLIIIDIIDDGAGIDVESVRAKAIEKGIIHPNKIITDQEAFQLIFEAGFSTSKKISNVSGRGVGLDVVKTQIEKLNGTVIVTSEKGVGSTFSIRLPLTLAIIQGLLVRVADQVYSIPIASVVESQRVKIEDINILDNHEVLNVRDEVISVLRLSRLFGIKNSTDLVYTFVVIVGNADKKIGIMVDALIGEEDIVIKPLSDQFTNSPGIAGASILGDGSVSLIIDVSQLLALGVRQELAAMESTPDEDKG